MIKPPGLVERQEHIVEPQSLRAVNRHDLHAGGIGQIAALLGHEVVHERGETRTWLQREFKGRGRTQHVREPLFGEGVETSGRQLRAQLLEGPHESPRRQHRQGILGDLFCTRKSMGIQGSPQRRGP